MSLQCSIVAKLLETGNVSFGLAQRELEEQRVQLVVADCYYLRQRSLRKCLQGQNTCQELQELLQ